jgi:Peptidase M15
MPRLFALSVAASILALSHIPPVAARDLSAQFSAVRSGPSTDRACLPGRLKDVLASIENRFGRVKVISTHRPGARIAGTHHMSLHATCRAVDFHPPAGKYHEVLAYLRTHWKGGLGTYSGQAHHLHLDVGHPKQWHTHLGGRSIVGADRPSRRRSAARTMWVGTHPY